MPTPAAPTAGTHPAPAQDLTEAPFQTATDYPQWKDQIATPAFQQFLGNKISADDLTLAADRRLVPGQVAAQQ